MKIYEVKCGLRVSEKQKSVFKLGGNVSGGNKEQCSAHHRNPSFYTRFSKVKHGRSESF